MNASVKAYRLVKQFEGLRLTSYRCPAGVWTIGFGHTVGVVEGMSITRDAADRLLDLDIRDSEKTIDKQKLALSQNQYDALVSFVYNVGAGNFVRSTLLRKIAANPSDGSIRMEFLRWVYVGKEVSLGLVRRRKAEVELYFSTEP